MSSKRFSSRLLAIFLALALMLSAIPTMAARPSDVQKITIAHADGIFGWFDREYSVEITDGSWGAYTVSHEADNLVIKPTSGGAFTELNVYLAAILDDDTSAFSVSCTEGGATVIASEFDGLGYIIQINLIRATGDVTITPIVKEPSVNVSFPTMDDRVGYQLYKDDAVTEQQIGEQEEVTKSAESKYKFSVKLNDDRKLAVPEVRVSGRANPLSGSANEAKDTYTYEIPTDSDKSVTVTLLDPWQVTIPESTNGSYTVTVADKETPYGAHEVRRGDAFKFTVEPAEGYKATVQWNGTNQTPGGSEPNSSTGKGEYMLTPTRDTPITITTSPLTFSITVTEDRAGKTHYNSTADHLNGMSVNYMNRQGSGAISFSLQPHEGYDAPEVTYTVAGTATENQPITPVNYVYTIPNEQIKGNVTINIGNVNLQSRTVTFTPTEGVTYQVQDKAQETATGEYGKPFTFKVQLDEAYDLSRGYKVLANGRTLTSETNEYIIPALNENTTITVTGVNRNTYDVTLEEASSGYTVDYNRSVQHGATYTFKVTTDTGYDAPTVEFVVSSHPGPDGQPSYGSEWTKAESLGQGMYRVQTEIVGPVKIKVTGQKTELTISEPTDVEQHHNEYSINFDDGNGKVNYGETLGFTVAPTAAYNVERVTLVNPGDQRVLRVLTPDRTDRDGSKHYTVESISTNAQINVEADATVLTVTITDSLDEGNRGTYQMVFSADPADLAIQRRDGKGNVDTDNGHLIGFPELGGENEDKYKGAYNCSWTYASGLPFDPETFAMPHEDTSIEITAKYEVNWSKVYDFKITAKWENPNEGEVFVLTITTSNLPNELVREVQQATVLGFGIFSSTTQPLNDNGTLENFLRGKGEDFNWRREIVSGDIVARNAMIMGTRFDASNGFSYMIGGYSREEANAGIHLRGWIVLRYNGTVQIVLNDGDVFSQNTPAADTPEEGPSMEEHNGDLEIYDGPVTDISEGVGLEFGPNEPEVPSEPLPADPEPVEPAPVAPMPVAENDVAA